MDQNKLRKRRAKRREKAGKEERKNERAKGETNRIRIGTEKQGYIQ